MNEDAPTGPETTGQRVRPDHMAEILGAMRNDAESAIARVVAGLEVDPADAALALESLRTASEELRVVEEELWRQRDVLVASGEFDDERVPPAQTLLMSAPVPYLVTTTTGTILVANAAASELLGQRHRLLLGRPLSAFNAKRRGAVQQVISAAVRSDRPVTALLHLRVPGGERTTRATVTSHVGIRVDDPVLAWVLGPLPGPPDPRLDELVGRVRQTGEADGHDAAEPAEAPAESPFADLLERSLGLIARATVAALAADGGSVTEPDAPSIGATDDDVRAADRIQLEARQSPGRRARTERAPQYSPDVAADERWPRTGEALVSECRFHSVLAIPLVWDDEVLGVLDVYARRRYAFAAHQLELADLLAGPAAAMLRHGQTLRDAHERAEHLSRAMDSRAAIEQAKAILVVRRGMTLDQAFAALTKYSQDHNRKLHDVAKEIVAKALTRSR